MNTSREVYSSHHSYRGIDVAIFNEEEGKTEVHATVVTPAGNRVQLYSYGSDVEHLKHTISQRIDQYLQKDSERWLCD